MNLESIIQFAVDNGALDDENLREAIEAFYTTPQQRPSRSDIKPLDKEQMSVVRRQAGYDIGEAKEIAAFISGIRHCEAAHGIKE